MPKLVKVTSFAKVFSFVRLRLEVLKSLCNRHPIVFQMVWVTTVGSWGTM